MRGRARMLRGRPPLAARALRRLRSMSDTAAAAVGALIGTAAASAVINFLL